MNPKSLIIPGVAALVLGLLFTSSESRAAEPLPRPPPPPPPPPNPDPVPTPTTPGPIKPAIRTRQIDASTSNPSLFAAKWGGSASLWKEIASVNPGMVLIDRQMSELLVDANGNYILDKNGVPVTKIYYVESTYVPADFKQPKYKMDWPGLLPWNMGQSVNIPAHWPG